MTTKKLKRKTYKSKPKAFVPTPSGSIPVRMPAAAGVKPVEVIKVTLVPDKVLCVEAPRDHIPIVAVHPTKSIVELAAVPKTKKRRTFLQWILGE